MYYEWYGIVSGILCFVLFFFVFFCHAKPENTDCTKKTNICVLENQTTDGNRNSECNKEREQDDRETK